jgi:hypothetical protein
MRVRRPGSQAVSNVVEITLWAAALACHRRDRGAKSAISWLAGLALGTATLSLLAVSGFGQTLGQPTPCGIAIGSVPGTKGLVLTLSGLVFDPNQGLGQGQGVCWLADANLAGNPLARALISPYLDSTNPLTQDTQGNPIVTTPVINPDGTMDYQTALNWVNALNEFNDGRGWLNHDDWQLPTTSPLDTSCSSKNNGNFGILCTGGALANLYNVGLERPYPDSVVPKFVNLVRPFVNLQPGLYWTRSSQNDAGFGTFSFNTGDTGANTTQYNFFHVLPMTHDVLGPVPAGPGVVPYTSGPGAGKAVYDSATGLSWTLDANLAATNNFGFADTIVLDNDPNDPDVNHTALPMTVPMIDKDGAMHFRAVCGPAKADDTCPPPASGWIVNMNAQGYAGSSSWRLPTIDQLAALYADMGLQAGDTRLEWRWLTGPFWRLQPGFYWSCERDASTTNNQAACDPSLRPPSANDTPMNFSFNFDDGFLGTSEFNKHFYVMVYFPIPATPQ